jgi:hypothetical protein
MQRRASDEGALASQMTPNKRELINEKHKAAEKAKIKAKTGAARVAGEGGVKSGDYAVSPLIVLRALNDVFGDCAVISDGEGGFQYATGPPGTGAIHEYSDRMKMASNCLVQGFRKNQLNRLQSIIKYDNELRLAKSLHHIHRQRSQTHETRQGSTNSQSRGYRRVQCTHDQRRGRVSTPQHQALSLVPETR